MKKNTFALLIFLFICVFSRAQTKESAGPVKTGSEWKMPTDAFTKSQAFASKLTKTLGLDSTTSKKVYTAYLANTKAVDEISVSPIGEEEKKVRMKANQQAFNETLKSILTPKQFEKYLKIEDGNRKR